MTSEGNSFIQNSSVGLHFLNEIFLTIRAASLHRNRKVLIIKIRQTVFMSRGSTEISTLFIWQA
jgi:hypothetical protein